MPTPQQSFAHMSNSQQSPQQSSNQPNGRSSNAPNHRHGYAVSFDGSQHSMSQPAPPTYSQSFSNGPVSNPGYARSFGEGAMGTMRGYDEQPQIYTAAYSGVSVYEMEVAGVAVMRRRHDGWLNATQILKIAGVDKGKRTKVLEKEILTGEHEKVQGGYGKYQGTWISYRRGREFCRQYGVEDMLRPLLDYDVSADGSQGQGTQETPTKEQAMAAQRKKFYSNNSSLDPRSHGAAGANGTFFSNISPTTSVALAAMNKAARLNSPRPSNMRRQSQQDPSNSQQSMTSDNDKKPDSGYNTQSNGEPPRKRMRPNSQSQDMGPPNLPIDASMQSITPTEANESFLYNNALMQESVNAQGEPIALPALPNPSTEQQQEKMNLILDLFAEQGRTDYSTHIALQQLSGEDLNMPLDASANNALHWAATLAKVPLLRLLIQKGASIWRGNAAGQSPLISAVLVNNCWEHSCFPELLEVLGPLIEVRDLQGRTMLHHIAVSSGIKGRAPSSKYYLEALLEFLVRIGTKPETTAGAQDGSSIVAAAAAQASHMDGEGSQDTERPSLSQPRGPISLVRFLSQIVNAQDKAGNTALNLVARIGNRSIIQQLVEIHADPNLPNKKGVSAKDFGVGLEQGEEPRYVNGGGLSSSQRRPPTYPNMPVSSPDGEAAAGTSSSQAEDLGQEVIASMTSMLTQNLASHKELLRSKAEAIDRLNEQIRDLSAMQKSELEKMQEQKERVRTRAERQAKIANLRREIEKKKVAAARKSAVKRKSSSPALHVDLEPEWLTDLNENLSSTRMDAHQRQLITSSIPASHLIRARVNAYAKSNDKLRSQADELRAKSMELERLYRKVVSLCTNVPEDKIDEALPALVAAVESERGGLGEQDVGRVREFLRRTHSGNEVEQEDEPRMMVNAAIQAAAERADRERMAYQAGPARGR